ncbi:carbohydrate-binding module family 52 protein [Xylariaceae sp. FL0804]|nr:carbohydrate-binding module family 52 protein [Xylariaceae sp. FL0804]
MQRITKPSVSVLSSIPVLGSFFRSARRGKGVSRTAAPEDNEDSWGLLEDDPLSIPLEDRDQGDGTDRPKHGFAKAAEGKITFRDVCFSKRTYLLIGTLGVILVAFIWFRSGPEPADKVFPCGTSTYAFLCPVIDGERLLRCGNSCYSPRKVGCENDIWVERQKQAPPIKSHHRSCASSYLHLSEPPYDNYFLSDCHSATQVVVTSPLPASDLRFISPRLLIAWPAGNSGIASYFSPANGVNGSLAITLEQSAGRNRSVTPLISGVRGVLSLNTSAVLELSILGSIRTIRDYVEGPSTLVPEIQDAVSIQELTNGGIQLSRLWLDGHTESFLSFHSTTGHPISIHEGQPYLENGSYIFNAWNNYPQLEQLSRRETMNSASQNLVKQHPDDSKALSFFSYTSKVVAGGWRFLTYFGRDSLITLLLLRPILSTGKSGEIESIIGAAIERINSADGSLCHEEIIGDYATWLSQQQGIDSNDLQCDYGMVDTDFYLPIAMDEYFVKTVTGRNRRAAFLATNATVIGSNQALTYENLTLVAAEKIMSITEMFENAPMRENLIHLKQDQMVGQWRDTDAGLGGGRVPYDVNTALVPAALRAIASLANGSVFPSHPDWAQVAADRATFWEDNTLQFFEVTISPDEAAVLVDSYVQKSAFPGPANTSQLTSPVNQQPVVNPRNQTQLSAFLSQVADNILRPFPLGLSTSVGLVIANPAYAGDSYHGTVVWSWQLAMMAAGLERQLGRCDHERLDFCSDTALHARILEAYDHLSEYAPFAALPTPEGHHPVESDIRQLWSLAFLAVKKNSTLSLGLTHR